MKIFISQLMNSLTKKQILKDRDFITKKIKEEIGDKFEVINSYVDTSPPDHVKNRSVWFLAESISFLAQADVAVFGPGWENGRGTVLENKIAKDYGIKTIEL